MRDCFVTNIIDTMNINEETITLIKDLSILSQNNNTENYQEFSLDQLKDIVYDGYESIDRRLDCINKLYTTMKYEEFSDFINAMLSLYNITGKNDIELFLTEICFNSYISVEHKLSITNCLLEYKQEYNKDDDEEYKTMIDESNNKKYRNACDVLEYICCSKDIQSSTLRVNIIEKLLMLNKDSYTETAVKCYKDVIDNLTINIEFKFCFIKNIEKLKVGKDKEICSELLYYMISYVYEERKHKSPVLEDIKNVVYYEILSCQYILTNNLQESFMFDYCQKLLYNISLDVNVEYNRRADASDVLLNFGDDKYKSLSRQVIISLGETRRGISTMFDNKQNVHVEFIENSVEESMSFISKINTDPLDFEKVREQITNFIKEDSYYSDKQDISKIVESINFSLKRIDMDSGLYSKYTFSMRTILLKIWCYIIGHENSQEMKRRMIEELTETKDTCSSGYIARMINSVTGLGDFGISMSFQDQITENFIFKLNKYVKNITDKSNSVFRKDRIREITRVYLIKTNLVEKVTEYSKLFKKSTITMEDLITNWLECKVTFFFENITPEIVEDHVVTWFQDSVLEELTIEDDENNRTCLNIFMSVYYNIIYDELSSEFGDCMLRDEFDIFFRNSSSHYGV